jgi:predicted TIM-barrel fold metal-dependent hydrolase
MTIDTHSHLFIREFYGERLWEGYTRLNARWHPPTMTPEDSEAEVRDSVIPSWQDLDGSGHIRRMDAAGIDTCILLYIDFGLLFPREGALSVEEQNRYVGELARKHPDRLIYFCGVDANREGAAALFERCVREFGARGLKLYPSTGFLPADRAAYPLYERAAAWKVPVYFHMGPQGPPYRDEGNTHPSTLLRVLVDFPDLKVVVAHLANEFWRDLLALGSVADNVFCDISAKQIVARETYGQFCHILRRFLDEFGRDRVMFGTDAPLLERAADSSEWVGIVQNLPENASEGIRFTRLEIDDLLDGNARRLLDGIPQVPVA